MTLKTFSDKAPATTISAKDLDDNFRRLRPLATDGNPRHYVLNETPDGWSIRVLPNFPNGVGPFLLGISNGQLYWTRSGVDEPEDVGNDGSVPNPPVTGTWVLGSINGTVQWIETEACT
jgi:hypothetical protein